jgi:outer membrane protein
VNRIALSLPLFLGMVGAAMAQSAPAQTKVGIIHIQNAIFNTKEGQKAFKELQDRFSPKKQDLEKKQADIDGLKSQFAKGSGVMSAEQKDKIARDIDTKTKSLNRDTEDAQAELDQENGKIMQDLGQKMMAVLDKYARDNGYSVILDVSSQQTPVLYAANSVDVTADVIKLYDQNTPAPSAPSSAVTKPPAAAPPAAAPPAAAPKTAPSPSPAIKKK